MDLAATRGGRGAIQVVGSLAFAAQCTAALTLALRQVRQLQVQHQLAEAMVSSSVIDQAIGILMGQQRCNAATAFDLLRQASQNRNRKLRDIAADIITNVSGEPPQPRPGFRTNPGQPANEQCLTAIPSRSRLAC